MSGTIQNGNSTYTELNVGVNGSKMDESSVTQVDPTTFATTQVHRERVVLGLDNGDLIGPPEMNGQPLPTSDRVLHAHLERIMSQLDTIIELLASR